MTWRTYSSALRWIFSKEWLQTTQLLRLALRALLLWVTPPWTIRKTLKMQTAGHMRASMAYGHAHRPHRPYHPHHPHQQVYHPHRPRNPHDPEFQPEWNVQPWGYVFDNAAFPQALIAPDAAFAQDAVQDSVGYELAQLASPSSTLFDAVQCVRNECVAATDVLDAQQACQCGAWALACDLGLQSTSAQASEFCIALAQGQTMCSALEPNLVQAEGTVTGQTVIAACLAP